TFAKAHDGAAPTARAGTPGRRRGAHVQAQFAKNGGRWVKNGHKGPSAPRVVKPYGEGICGSDGDAVLSRPTKQELASGPPGGGVRRRLAVTNEQVTAATARSQGERADARVRHWRSPLAVE